MKPRKPGEILEIYESGKVKARFYSDLEGISLYVISLSKIQCWKRDNPVVFF